jgi:hypothetical protein
MERHAFDSTRGGTVELDLCFGCQGMWFEPQENLQLTPSALVDLFRLLHDKRHAAHTGLPQTLHCTHCQGALTQGFDVVRSGRYVTYRCAKRHGRFSTFSAFMIEKGFVRQLTRPEVEDIARRAPVIHCNSCGAPADLRKDHACTHCRSAFTLLDPKAVEHALAGYAKAAHAASGVKLPDLADALIMLERDRQAAAQEAKAQGRSLLQRDANNIDLWAVGVSLVWQVLN